MALLSRLSHVSMGKETTQGTGVAPTIYIPVTGVKPEDVPQYIRDESLFGNQSLVRGVYQGELDSTFDFDGLLYFEHLGSYLVGCGFVDTVTGSSAPYTHTFKLSASGAQPPTWSMTDYNTVEARRYPGCMVDQFDLTLDAKGAIKYAMKMKGWPSASAATPVPTFPATAAALGWETKCSIGGASSARVVSAGLSVKRSTEQIHTFNNTQNPYQVFAGPFDSSYKAKALFENNTDWNHLNANDQLPFVLTVTAPGGGNNPVLTMTSTIGAWVKAPIDRSQKYMQVDVDILNVYNATDGGEFAALLTNAVSTAY